ncbi:MAG: hypothetical protein IJX77_10320 [Ruminococcus sp.]|nr:hypothetical protein [Ruminococcus sp.]
MLKNADCTFYEKDTFARHTVRGVYWNDSRGTAISKNGIQISDSVLIYLYSDEYVPKNGDIAVRGGSDFEFDCTSQKKSSESMKHFRELYPGFAVVKSLNDVRFGGLPHIEVTAR